MDQIMEKESLNVQEEQLALLQDIKKRLDEMERREKRRRIRTWLLLALLLVGAAAAYFAIAPKLRVAAAQYEQTAAKIQELSGIVGSLEVEKFQDAADFIGSVDYSKLMELSGVLESLDAQQLEEQISRMTEMVDKLGELNMDDLVENLNLIVDKIKPIMKFLKG